MEEIPNENELICHKDSYVSCMSAVSFSISGDSHTQTPPILRSFSTTKNSSHFASLSRSGR